MVAKYCFYNAFQHTIGEQTSLPQLCWKVMNIHPFLRNSVLQKHHTVPQQLNYALLWVIVHHIAYEQQLCRWCTFRQPLLANFDNIFCIKMVGNVHNNTPLLAAMLSCIGFCQHGFHVHFELASLTVYPCQIAKNCKEAVLPHLIPEEYCYGIPILPRWILSVCIWVSKNKVGKKEQHILTPG